MKSRISHRSRLLAAAALSALAFSPAALLAEQPATAPSNYSDEIKLLRQRLDELEARQKAVNENRQEAERKLDEKITSEQLGAQAAQHDQFISAEGFTAGYTDGRFVIQSADGNFVLRPWFHLQTRAVVNERNNFQGNKKEGPEDETNAGFEIRRMKFEFDGNAFGPDLTYLFQWATQRTSSNATVRRGKCDCPG